MSKPEYIPTPSVGTTVQFFSRSRPPECPVRAENEACAAVVLALHNQPGKVALRLLGGAGQQFRMNVDRIVDCAIYAEHPEVLARDDQPDLIGGGSWRFPPTDTEMWHKQFLKKRAEQEAAAAKDREYALQREEERRKKIEEGRLLAARKR